MIEEGTGSSAHLARYLAWRIGAHGENNATVAGNHLLSVSSLFSLLSLSLWLSLSVSLSVSLPLSLSPCLSLCLSLSVSLSVSLSLPPCISLVALCTFVSLCLSLSLAPVPHRQHRSPHLTPFAAVAVAAAAVAVAAAAAEALRLAADMGDSNAQVLYAAAHLAALGPTSAAAATAAAAAADPSGVSPAAAGGGGGGRGPLLLKGNATEALTYFSRAALAGHPEATYSAGLLLLQGASPLHKTTKERCIAAYKVCLSSCLSPYIYIHIYIIIISVCLSLPLCLTASISLSLPVCQCLLLPLVICLPVSLCLCLSFCLPVSLSVSLCLSLLLTSTVVFVPLCILKGLGFRVCAVSLCLFLFQVLEKVALLHRRVNLLHALSLHAHRKGDISGALLLQLLLSEVGHLGGHVNAAALWPQAAAQHQQRQQTVRGLLQGLLRASLALAAAADADKGEATKPPAAATAAAAAPADTDEKTQQHQQPAAEGDREEQQQGGKGETVAAAAAAAGDRSVEQLLLAHYADPSLDLTAAAAAAAAPPTAAAAAAGIEAKVTAAGGSCLLPSRVSPLARAGPQRLHAGGHPGVYADLPFAASSTCAAADAADAAVSDAVAARNHLQHLRVSEFIRCWLGPPGPLDVPGAPPATACRFAALRRAALQVRARDREIERQRNSERETDTATERETDGERDRETDRERDRERETEKDREGQTERDKDRGTERKRQRERDRER